MKVSTFALSIGESAMITIMTATRRSWMMRIGISFAALIIGN